MMRTYVADLFNASRHHTLLRLSILLGLGLFIGALFGVGFSFTPQIWITIIVVVGLLAALVPHGPVASVLLVLCAGLWILTTPPSSAPWVLLAGWGLLIVHLGTSLSAAVPPQSNIPTDVWRRYGRRLLVIAGISTGIYLLYVLSRAGEVTGGPVPALLALLLVTGGIAAHYIFVTRRAVRDATVIRY